MKLPKSTPNLKQFMLQKKVISLYRELFRATKLVEDKASRKELQDWIRADFKNRKDERNEDIIKNLVYQGEMFLKELTKNINLSK